MKNNDIEFEVKFYPIDKVKFRKKLISLGAKLIIPERKMVRWVADYRENSILGKRECIRVRDENGLVRLSYKAFAGNSNKVTDQKEVETEVKNFKATVRIFEKIGLKFNRNQETKREEWRFRNAQITIDTWPGIKPFVEIEGDSEDQVKKVSIILGFDWDEKLVVPASGLYAKVYGVDDAVALEKTSNITFKNPPFKGIKKVWPE